MDEAKICLFIDMYGACVFVRDAIFLIHVERYSYVWKPERSCMYDSLVESERGKD